MKKTSFKTTPFLSRFIDRIYTINQSSESGFKLPLILPGTGLELLFHTNTPLSFNGNTTPIAHTFCPRITMQSDTMHTVDYIAVRFKTGAFRHFCSIPFTALINQHPSVEEIWPKSGRNLLERIAEEPHLNGKINRINQFLTHCFHLHHIRTDQRWDTTIQQLYYQHQHIDLADLAYDQHMSYRNFERYFKQQFGTSPKKYQRTVKLESTVKKLLLNRSSDYLDVALEMGYYDQSHFIRDFKSFTGLTPSVYLEEKTFDNHFYNRPLPH